MTKGILLVNPIGLIVSELTINGIDPSTLNVSVTGKGISIDNGELSIMPASINPVISKDIETGKYVMSNIKYDTEVSFDINVGTIGSQ